MYSVVTFLRTLHFVWSEHERRPLELHLKMKNMIGLLQSRGVLDYNSSQYKSDQS